MTEQSPALKSDQQAAPPNPEPTGNSESDSFQAIIPTKNMPALIGYYMGIFGLLPFIGLPFSVAAVILGRKGLSLYKQQPTPGAKTHAMIGYVLGIVELVVFVLFVAFVVAINTQK